MLEQMGIAAKQASYKLAQLSSREKNRVLEKSRIVAMSFCEPRS